MAMRELVSFCLALALVAGQMMMSGCARTDAGGDTPEPRQSASQVPVVVLSPPGHQRAAVTVDIARTPDQIQRGLMYRRSMPADHGMLFLMGEERIHSFWMRNTYIPLDMIFIGKDMKVAGVVANTTPLTEDSRRVDRPSYYVLEVNAGWAAAHHIGPGTPVRFKNVKE
jgi:uncharacterized protein